MSNPAVAHLQTATLYTRVRGKREYLYANVAQLRRLLARTYDTYVCRYEGRVGTGGVLSEGEYREIAAIIETCSDKEDSQF